MEKLITNLSDRERKRYSEGCETIARYANQLATLLTVNKENDIEAKTTFEAMVFLGTTVSSELGRVFQEAVMVPEIPDNISDIL